MVSLGYVGAQALTIVLLVYVRPVAREPTAWKMMSTRHWSARQAFVNVLVSAKDEGPVCNEVIEITSSSTQR